MEPGPKKMDLGTEQEPNGILELRGRRRTEPKKMDPGPEKWSRVRKWSQVRKIGAGSEKNGPKSGSLWISLDSNTPIREIDPGLKKWSQVRKIGAGSGKMDPGPK